MVVDEILDEPHGRRREMRRGTSLSARLADRLRRLVTAKAQIASLGERIGRNHGNERQTLVELRGIYGPRIKGEAERLAAHVMPPRSTWAWGNLVSTIGGFILLVIALSVPGAVVWPLLAAPMMVGGGLSWMAWAIVSHADRGGRGVYVQTLYNEGIDAIVRGLHNLPRR